MNYNSFQNKLRVSTPSPPSPPPWKTYMLTQMDKNITEAKSNNVLEVNGKFYAVKNVREAREKMSLWFLRKQIFTKIKNNKEWEH